MTRDLVMWHRKMNECGTLHKTYINIQMQIQVYPHTHNIQEPTHKNTHPKNAQNHSKTYTQNREHIIKECLYKAFLLDLRAATEMEEEEKGIKIKKKQTKHLLNNNSELQ